MSSSYSTDLRLELIGTGDQAGVWGSTTNNTLGTLMEAAIAGYTSVAIIASPQALTALDGATDQSRYNSIALTTTTGANFVVCTPPTPKLYTFYNSTAYTATITNATAKNGTTPTGGTTVIIPAGKTMSMWTDGTNFTQQSDHFIQPTLASPTMTGTPVAPTATLGTSTTQLATTAFVQAALQVLHPIGSIYTNVTSTNPGTLFGFGTWTAFGAGRVMVGLDAGNTLFDTAEETGGSYNAVVGNHTHTFSATSGGQSQTHSHTATDSGHTHAYSGSVNPSDRFQYSGGGGTAGIGTPLNAGFTTASGNANISVGNASQDHSHSVSGTSADASVAASVTNANIQPYITVYMWKRTA